jgi:hypothetical protein
VAWLNPGGEVARQAHEADDPVAPPAARGGRLAPRQLVREAPAGRAVRIQVQLQLAGDLGAAAQHALVLFPVAFAQAAAEQLVGVAADQLCALRQAQPVEQRLVGVRVAAAGVLGEEDDVGQRVEQPLQQRQRQAGGAGQRFQGGGVGHAAIVLKSSSRCEHRIKPERRAGSRIAACRKSPSSIPIPRASRRGSC